MALGSAAFVAQRRKSPGLDLRKGSSPTDTRPQWGRTAGDIANGWHHLWSCATPSRSMVSKRLSIRGSRPAVIPSVTSPRSLCHLLYHPTQKNPDAGKGIRIYDDCRFSTYEDSQCAGGAIGKDFATQVEAWLCRSLRTKGGAVDGEIGGVCLCRTRSIGR